MNNVFISYSIKDKKYVDQLIHDLESYGVSVWYDRYIDGEKRFQDEIEDRINKATVVLALWSENSIQSRYVIDEANLAADNKKLLSAKFGGVSVKDLPLGLRGQNLIEFSDQNKLFKSIAEYGIYAKEFNK